MGKLFRYLLYFITLLVVLIIAAVILIPQFFNPNDFKPQIASIVKEKTGRDLNIAGDLQLSVFPWLGVSVDKTTLNEDPMFGGTTFVTLDHADVKIKVIPLLSKKVEVDRVSIDGLKLNLVTLANGKSNWEALQQRISSGTSSKDASIVTQAPELNGNRTEQTSGFALSDLSVAGLALHNANIRLDDRKNKRIATIEQLNLNLDGVSFDSAVPFDADFIANLNQPQLRDKMRVSGELNINEALDRFKIQNLQLESTLEGEVVSQGKVKLVLNSPSIDFDKTNLSAELASGLELVIDGAGGSLPASFDSRLKLPKLSLTHQLKQFDLGQIELALNAKGEQLPGGKLTATLSALINGDLNSQTMNISGLELAVEELLASADLQGTKILDNPNFTGNLAIAELNPKQLANKLGITLPVTQNAQALTSLALNSQLKLNKQSAEFKQLQLALDQSKLSGNLAITDFATQALNFDLVLDRINLDDYLPPKAERKKKSTPNKPLSIQQQTAKAARQMIQDAEPIIPVEMLRKLNVNGKLKINELLVNELQAKQVSFRIKSRGGLLEAHPAIGKLYDGKVGGTIKIDSRTATPSIQITDHLADLAIAKLIEAVTGETYISGTTQLNSNLTTKGVTKKQLLANLNGNINAAFLDGAIYGVNIPKMIRDGMATLEGKATSADATNKTDFSEINMVSSVKNGVVNTKSLELKSPLIRILGNGTVNLNNNTVNLRMNTKLVDSLRGQGGNQQNDLSGIPIPLLISGTFDNIQFSLDTQSAIKELAKTKAGKKLEAKANKVIEKHGGKIKDKLDKKLGEGAGKALGDKAGKLLKGLF